MRWFAIYRRDNQFCFRLLLWNRNECSASLHWPRLRKTFAAFLLDSVGVYSRGPLNDERDSLGHLDFHLLASLPKTALFDLMNKYHTCIISIFTLHNSYTFRITFLAHIKKFQIFHNWLSLYTHSFWYCTDFAIRNEVLKHSWSFLY